MTPLSVCWKKYKYWKIKRFYYFFLISSFKVCNSLYLHRFLFKEESQLLCFGSYTCSKVLSCECRWNNTQWSWRQVRVLQLEKLLLGYKILYAFVIHVVVFSGNFWFSVHELTNIGLDARKRGLYAKPEEQLEAEGCVRSLASWGHNYIVAFAPWKTKVLLTFWELRINLFESVNSFEIPERSVRRLKSIDCYCNISFNTSITDKNA